MKDFGMIDFDKDDDTLCLDKALAAEKEKRWIDAACLWHHVRTVYPNLLNSYTGEARALRECGRMEDADTILVDAVTRFPNKLTALTEYAWLALIRRNFPEAARRWIAVTSQFPNHSEAYIRAAQALMLQFNFVEAEQLLKTGMSELPDDADIATQHACVAYEQGRWPEATERFTEACGKFPYHAEAWRGAALTARNQSRFTEADSILARALQQIPDSAELTLEHAKLPVFPIFAADKNWAETLRRMERLRSRFPQFIPGYVHGVKLLQEVGLTEAAEWLGEKSVAKFPDNIDLALAFARAAGLRQDWREAISRFDTLLKRFQNISAAEIGLAEALAESGQIEEAEKRFSLVMVRYPDAASGFAGHADMAGRRGNWPEAVRRWGDAERRFPGEKHISHRLYEARMRMMEDAPDATRETSFQLAAAVKPDVSQIDLKVAELVTQFESLGGRGLGCEFGIFQRECGAEPLGLLRWADMPFKPLVATLNNRFEGVGSEEHTELFISAISGGKGEYCTRDRRGMMFMRAFVAENEMPFDRMFTASCRRIRFLTRKLIEDLESGSKIFVFRITDRNLDKSEIAELHKAMRHYGENTLLYVRYEDAEHPSGFVEQLRPGLLIGYMDRFKVSPNNELSAAPPTASWLAVCRAAYDIWVNRKG